MNPSVVTLLVFTVLSVVSADVSHLSGYQYPINTPNIGTASLKLHTADSPALTQYHGSFSTNGETLPNLPNSYVPPASGNPFESAAPPAPQTYPSQTLSPPLPPSTSGLTSTTSYQTQTLNQEHYQHLPNRQQYQKQYQQGAYQQTTYQQPANQQNTYQQTAYQQPNYEQQTYQQPQLQQSAYQTSGQSSQTSGQSPINYNNVQNQEPIITKHFYVHAAPEEPEEDIGPQYVNVGQPHKTYKIIFIKTPTYGVKSQIIPVLPQNEEKTIVYVLSKKPSFDSNIQLPEATTNEPLKPDVFFVKYKTKEEAEHAQQAIQDAYNQVQESDSQSTVDASGTDTNGGLGFGGQLSTQSSEGGHYTSTADNRNRRHIA